ncbi:MAG: penicillin-binding protein 2 [Alphaproteobacteria bacterium]|nr:penicillin-binding protein 2 [Alphaproteobacteria bacterium]
MSNGVIITPGLAADALRQEAAGGFQTTRAERADDVARGEKRAVRVRALVAIGCMALGFLSVGIQLMRLAANGGADLRVSMSAPIATSFSRPEIVDRNGRLMAGDLVMQSLFADPSVVLDRDEVAEKLSTVLPGVDQEKIRKNLSDKAKRFVWVRRGLSTWQAQQIHELGLPALSFRKELRRAYPLGRTAGHILGSVDVDNKGLSGLELYLDERQNVDRVHGASLSARPAVRLSLDVAVQYGLEEELSEAMKRYSAKAALGLVMDVHTGEIVAAASLPGIDPHNVSQRADEARIDRLMNGTFELGSVFKMFTTAMALEGGKVHTGTEIDVSQPLRFGRYQIKDHHFSGRFLSVEDVFLKSSNVGSGILALGEGAERQRQFLEQLGLTSALETEAGFVAQPRLPERWGELETVTVAYGHGLAVAPMQFAAAAATLVNGGYRIKPTFLRKSEGKPPKRARVISPETSGAIRRLMRENVASGRGTGSRADVPGLEVGGKTGTAEIPGADGYEEKAVIASFVGAFPMQEPRYLTLVSLFEPKGVKETRGAITAGWNAAPTTARVIARVAPLLGYRVGGREE